MVGVIIGSVPLAYYYPDFPRLPADIDIISNPLEILAFEGHNAGHLTRNLSKHQGKFRFRHDRLGQVEFEDTSFIHSARILYNFYQDYTGGTFLEIGGLRCIMAIPDHIYLMKKAHVNHPAHWAKTIEDYHWLKGRMVSVVGGPFLWKPEELEFYEQRREESRLRHPNLNQTNEKFFGQSKGYVTQIYPHDAVHFATCYGSVPIYTLLKRDQRKAWCRKDIWETSVTEECRLNCVREEAMVVALERFILMGVTEDQNLAYQWALKKICTTLCSGWFRDFAVENWPVLKDPTHDYVADFSRRISGVLHSQTWKEYYS